MYWCTSSSWHSHHGGGIVVIWHKDALTIPPHLTLRHTSRHTSLCLFSPTPPSSSLILHSMVWLSVRGSNVQYWPAPTSPAERTRAVLNALVSNEHTHTHTTWYSWYIWTFYNTLPLIWWSSVSGQKHVMTICKIQSEISLIYSHLKKCLR